MGNSEIKHSLWVAITANDPETVRNICIKYNSLINDPISDDNKTNAVTRAAFLDRPHILAELSALGADLNRAAKSGISALMWAAARGNLESVKFLLNFGADAHQKGPNDLIATDFAVLYGFYNTAHYLYTNGFLPTKSAEEYQEIKKAMQINYVDYPGILMSLQKEIPPDVVPYFTLAPIKREPTLTDPVRDPEETWKDWMNRVIEFQKPPLVERNSLPAALQPQNTFTGKVKILMRLENAPASHPDILIDHEDARKVVPVNTSVIK